MSRAVQKSQGGKNGEGSKMEGVVNKSTFVDLYRNKYFWDRNGEL